MRIVEAIMEEADAVTVACGDRGLEMPAERAPQLQRLSCEPGAEQAIQ